MDKNVSSQDTTALTRQPPADQVRAIDRFVSRFYWAMVAMANRMIRLQHIDQALYDGEDAVVTTWYKLRKAADGGKLHPLQTSGHLWRLFHSSVNREIRTERDRFRRRKRGGERRSRAGWNGRHAPEENGIAGERVSHRNGEDLADLTSPQSPPEVLISSKEQVERLLDRLKCPVLRSIVTLLADQYTNEEIAQQLGLTTRTIERKLATIRRRLSGPC